MDYSLIYNINGEINNFTNEIKAELPPKKKKMVYYFRTPKIT